MGILFFVFIIHNKNKKESDQRFFSGTGKIAVPCKSWAVIPFCCQPHYRAV